MDKQLLADALAYAARGWLVFPCLPSDKRPATPRGFHDATTNSATIARWWGARPYNIGIATGPLSGLWVLDLDGPEADLGGELPATLEASTGRGRHLYFADRTGLPSSAGRIAPGVDARGVGGYVVGPPSLHSSGTRYAWRNDLPLAPVPDWLVRLAHRPPSTSERASAGIWPPAGSPAPAESGRYGRAAMTAEVAELARAPKGQRNARLNRAAFVLHQLVAGGEVTQREVLQGLFWACDVNGLLRDDGERSVRATIQSGSTAGLAAPRGRAL
jgi:putative DNA primase/helicase